MTAPWMVAPDLNLDTTVDNPWHPQTPAAADWCFGRLAQVESEIRAIEAQRAEWQLQLDDWHEAVSRRPKADREFFTGRLEDYARRQRDETGTATLTLPGGRVTSRRNPAKVIVTDHQVVLDWAKDCDVPVIKETLLLDRLRRMVVIRDGRPVSQDGEVVAGLDVEAEFTSYSVKVAT